MAGMPLGPRARAKRARHGRVRGIRTYTLSATTWNDTTELVTRLRP